MKTEKDVTIVETYETPYGRYTIVDTGLPYEPAIPIDTTPISPSSPVNKGGVDINIDGVFLMKTENVNEAKSLVRHILLKTHRYVVPDNK